MSLASTQLLRSVMAVVLALGLALTAVGGTMAQEDRGNTRGNTPEDRPVKILSIEVEDASNTTDLRGKNLRISVNEDGSYSKIPSPRVTFAVPVEVPDD